MKAISDMFAPSFGWAARFDSGALELERYPFGDRERRVPANELSEVCVNWSPPAVRTRGGEFLFVPAPDAASLAGFASSHGVPFVRRADVWSFILDPFLDTEMTDDWREKVAARLEENGVSAAEAERWRRRVRRRMLALTALTWEWVYYGLFDVLTAMRPATVTTGWRFRTFYAAAMALANRGRTTPATSGELLQRFGKRA